MRMQFAISLLSLLFTAVYGNVPNRVFATTVIPIPGVAKLVSGRVAVFVVGTDTVAYAGTASGVNPSLDPSNCTAVNGTRFAGE